MNLIQFFNYLIVILIFIIQSSFGDQLECTSIDDDHRVDCYPEDWSSSELCESRGCCWREPSQANATNVPYCFYPTNYNGYKPFKIVQGYDSLDIYFDRKQPSGFPNDHNSIIIHLQVINNYRLMIIVKSQEDERWRPPVELDLDRNEYLPRQARLFTYDFDESYIKVIRKETNETIWKMNYRNMIFSDQYLQVETYIPSLDLFGLGEHKDTYRKSFEKVRKSFLIWNQGDAPDYNRPLYSAHPMYLAYEDRRSNDQKILAHTVLLLNSNAAEAVLSPGKALIWRSIGGQLEFYINLGSDPVDAVSKYVKLVGKPELPPYWALGFHLSRYGYNNLTNMKQTYKRMKDNKIPLDTIWNDIDLYRDHNIFSYDNISFEGMPEFIYELKKENIHYIPMLDPGLGGNFTNEEYPALHDGLKKNVFLKMENGKLLETRVWNRFYTLWVDFTHPNASDFWIKQLVELYNDLEFDGLWIDMNSPDANGVDGSLEGCDWDDKFEKPYFIPNGLGLLSRNTACMKAKHHLGDHYNIHNMYSYFEANITNLALKRLKKRPFIISRSSFVGHGRFASKWSGDVSSSWDDLRISISNLLSFNIYGIPITGADICGFLGNTDVELCARWQSLGAFYTFSRNHNDISSIDQDPPALGQLVIDATKYSLNIRYSLLPLLYTELYKASIYGNPVIRSLSLVYPEDKVTYNIETQFMWGDSVMIIPIVERGETVTDAYLPAGIWYDYLKQEIVSKSVKQGNYLKMNIPMDRIGVLVRGGRILFTQKPATTTEETRKSKFDVMVALNENNEAEGDLYYDDGEDYKINETGKFNFVTLIAYKNVLFNKITRSGYSGQPLTKSISVLNVNFKVTKVTINRLDAQFTYDPTTQKLMINEKVDLTKQFIIVWN